jgi:hypothetical protein
VKNSFYASKYPDSTVTHQLFNSSYAECEIDVSDLHTEYHMVAVSTDSGGYAPWTVSKVIEVMVFPSVSAVWPDSELPANIPTDVRLSLNGTAAGEPDMGAIGVIRFLFEKARIELLGFYSS